MDKANSMHFSSNGECINICTWNVEGLTDIKIEQVCSYMNSNSLDVTILQETRRLKSDYFQWESGHHIYLSGSSTGEKEWAGVGFIVSGRFHRRVLGFTPTSNRVGSIRVKTLGGSLAIIGTYAPHNRRPLDERLAFYDTLETHLDKSKVSGEQYIIGDMNARLGRRRPGEEDHVGDYTFGREAQQSVEVPNRDLLMELCVSRRYAIANTFVPNEPSQQVTYYEVGSTPASPITETTFAMLDIVLVPVDSMWKVRYLHSDPLAAMSTHHFPVTVRLCVEQARRNTPASRPKYDFSALSETRVRDAFLHCVSSLRHDETAEEWPCLNTSWERLRSNLVTAASEVIPEISRSKRRSWISDATLRLIEHRARCRQLADAETEKRAAKEINKSARQDRARWLRDMASQGTWASLTRLRRGRKVAQTRLQPESEAPVRTEDRAATFAKYLETVQWHVRPVSGLDDAPEATCSPLDIREGNFSSTELRKAINRMASGKSVKPDDVPIEFLKVLAASTGENLQPLLDVMNMCLLLEQVPQE